MTEEQAVRVLATAAGRATAYVKVVKISKGRYGATHAVKRFRRASLREQATRRCADHRDQH
jgi:hypothetical protein